MFARQRRDAARIEELEASLEELRQEEERTRAELARESAARLDALRELRDLREFKDRADLADIQRRREEASALVDEELAERRRAMDEELRAAEREHERKLDELGATMRRAEEDDLRRRGQQRRAHRMRREELRRELDAYRDETQAEVRARVATFGENYLYYLEQIRLLMERLSASSLEVGEVLLTDDGADPTALFQRAMGDGVEAELGLPETPMTADRGSAAATSPSKPAIGPVALDAGEDGSRAVPIDRAPDAPPSPVPGTGEWLDFQPRDEEVRVARVEAQRAASTRIESEGGDGDAPEVVMDEDEMLQAEIDELASAISGLRETHLASQRLAEGDVDARSAPVDGTAPSEVDDPGTPGVPDADEVPVAEELGAASPQRASAPEDVEVVYGSRGPGSRDAASEAGTGPSKDARRDGGARSSRAGRPGAGDAIGEGVGRVWAVVSTVLFALLMVCVVWLVWLMLVEDLAFTDALASMGATFGTWFGGAR